MNEIFFVNWSVEDARRIAELIVRKADEAKKMGDGAEVMLRFVKNAEKSRHSVNVAVLAPQVRLVVDVMEDGL